jgi:hypothetical protein
MEAGGGTPDEAEATLRVLEVASLEVLEHVSGWVVAKIAKRRMLKFDTIMLPPPVTMPAPEPAIALPQPAEATRELGDPGPVIVLSPPPAEVAAVRGFVVLGKATTLRLLAEAAAAARGHGAPGPATALPPPAEAAATHAHGAAKNLVCAKAALFIKAGSSLKPAGTKVTAHPQTATSASLLPGGVVCGALGMPPGACAYFFSPGGCNRGPECWFSHVKPTAAQLRRVQRRKAGTPKRASRGEKRAGKSLKGSPLQEPMEPKGFLSCCGLEVVLRPTAGCHKRVTA